MMWVYGCSNNKSEFLGSHGTKNVKSGLLDYDIKSLLSDHHTEVHVQ